MSRKQEYIDSVDGNAHQSAVEIIADLERQLEAANQTCSDAREQEYGCFRAVQAERQLAEAQENERRYLWLKENKIEYVAGYDDMQWATMEWCTEVASLAPSTLDEAIDAAIDRAEPKAEPKLVRVQVDFDRTKQKTDCLLVRMTRHFANGEAVKSDREIVVGEGDSINFEWV